MCWLSCFIIFWTTKYNTPRTFCLASYSVVFCDHCLRFTTHPTTTQTAYEPLGATLRTNTLPFLVPTDWLVLQWRTAPPVSFPCTCVTLRRLSTCSFHYYQLCCYLHRSYGWSVPHGTKQACLSELLLAELCRHTSFGCVTTVILRKRQAVYRMLNHP
jgi:hypothetical protein